MKALSLFSGIGGIDLAAEWANIQTVAFCEREPFCQKVLAKHWPAVPIYDDVCTLTKERIDADGIEPIDIIFSGDPCQPYSVAGGREGEEDDRFLWPEVSRLLKTIRPAWVVRENVAGNITLGIDGVLADLENLSYTWETFVLPACGIGAPHKRERIFIVAHTNCNMRGRQRRTRTSSVESEIREDAKRKGNTKWDAAKRSGKVEKWEVHRGNEQWTTEPVVDRMVDGVSAKLDEHHRERLRALGNAVVPQQIYPILAAIKQIDDMLHTG